MCIMIKGREGKFLKIQEGLRQSCAMSSWLFNIFTNCTFKDIDRTGKGTDILSTRG